MRSGEIPYSPSLGLHLNRLVSPGKACHLTNFQHIFGCDRSICGKMMQRVMDRPTIVWSWRIVHLAARFEVACSRKPFLSVVSMFVCVAGMLYPCR